MTRAKEKAERVTKALHSLCLKRVKEWGETYGKGKQTEIAKLLGSTNSTVGRFLSGERGKERFTISLFLKIYYGLGLNIDDILEAIEPHSPRIQSWRIFLKYEYLFLEIAKINNDHKLEQLIEAVIPFSRASEKETETILSVLNAMKPKIEKKQLDIIQEIKEVRGNYE